MNGNLFAWIYKTQKHFHKIQAEVLSINPEIHTPFIWYSLIKGVNKI